MKISFHSYANKTNFHMKRFALSLAFINQAHSNSEMAYFSHVIFNVYLMLVCRITEALLKADRKILLKGTDG